MKKKLFILNSLSNGGAERVVANLANAMSDEGNTIHIILLNKKIDYEVSEKIKVHHVNASLVGKARKFFSLAKIREELLNIIKEIELDGPLDLITVHLPFPHLVFRDTEYSDRTFYVIHTVYSKKFTKFRFFFKGILKKLYDNRNIVSVSKGVGDELVDYWGIKPRKLAIIHNPINMNEISQQLQAKEVPEYDNYILAVGRLVQLKGFDKLISAFSESTLHHNYKLIILGEGPERDNLQKQITKLNFETKVILKGWESNPYIWMKHASLFVLSSEYEAFPMVLIEALSCNTPIVSTNCNYGPKEILIDELSKYLVSTDDTIELSTKMEMAVSSYPEISEKYIKPYLIQNIIKQYMELKN